ncbi:MAG: hypothetical protein ACM3S1_04260 [Hyphomicrobiales bacterium]
MIRKSFPHPLFATAALALLAVIAVGAALWQTKWTSASPGGPASLPDAGEYVSFTEDQHLDYEYRNASLPDNAKFPELRTKTVAQLDESGNVVAFRNWTWLPSGELYQQQEYASGEQIVTWWAGGPGKMPCTERFAWKPAGSGLPVVTPQTLEADRYSISTTSGTGVEVYTRPDKRVPDPRLTSWHGEIERDATTGQILADVHTATTVDGRVVELESRRYSPIQPATAEDFLALRFDEFGACSVGAPAR